jgi:hypothetical protein
MSDKPLDCIGLDLGTARVGKHDFRLDSNVTTNTVAQPPAFNMASLTKAMSMLNAIPSEEERIDHARVGKDYLKALESRRTIVDTPPSFGGGMLGSLAGFKIISDDDLPPDVCELCNKDGKVLYAVTLQP